MLTVAQLKKKLEGIPDKTRIVMPGRDHNYTHFDTVRKEKVVEWYWSNSIFPSELTEYDYINNKIPEEEGYEIKIKDYLVIS